MDEHGRHTLVEAYLHHRTLILRGESTDATDWAFATVDGLIDSDPTLAWEVTLMLIDRATDDGALAYVAAGPLEDILMRHGARFIDRVAERARSDARLRSALTGVWGHERMAPEVARRIEALIKGEPPL